MSSEGEGAHVDGAFLTNAMKSLRLLGLRASGALVCAASTSADRALGW